MIHVGQKFGNLSDLKQAIEQYEKEKFVQLYISHSRSIESAKKRGLQKVIKPELCYAELRYSCINFGKYRSRSKGLRPNQKTYRQGCKSHIRLKASDDGQFLEVVACNEEHTHEVSKEYLESILSKYEEPERKSKIFKKRRMLFKELKVPVPVSLQEVTVTTSPSSPAKHTLITPDVSETSSEPVNNSNNSECPSNNRIPEALVIWDETPFTPRKKNNPENTVVEESNRTNISLIKNCVNNSRNSECPSNNQIPGALVVWDKTPFTPKIKINPENTVVGESSRTNNSLLKNCVNNSRNSECPSNNQIPGALVIWDKTPFTPKIKNNPENTVVGESSRTNNSLIKRQKTSNELFGELVTSRLDQLSEPECSAARIKILQTLHDIQFQKNKPVSCQTLS